MRDLVDLDRLLGEHRAGALLAIGGLLPLVVELVADRDELGLVEQRELLVAAAQDEPLEDRFDDRVRVDRDGDGDPERVADRPVLAQENVEDDPVDAVVAAEVGEHPHRVALLPVAVDAALALLVPGRVPGEVVVDDGVEVLLQVDALRQAVGCDEHPLVGLAEGEDALLALAVGRSPVTASTWTAFGSALRSAVAT